MQSTFLVTLLVAMLRQSSSVRCIIGTSGMDLYGREGPFVGNCPTYVQLGVPADAIPDDAPPQVL